MYSYYFFLYLLFNSFWACHPAIHSTNDVWPYPSRDQIFAVSVVCSRCVFLDPNNWIHCLIIRPVDHSIIKNIKGWSPENDKYGVEK